jgi:hypothetical protein
MGRPTPRAELRRLSRAAARRNNRPMRLAAAAACCLLSAPAWGQANRASFDRDCSQWIEKKGFLTDYIKLKTGKRQRGMAETWRGNVEPKHVQPGDVFLTHIKDKGKRMRASYVEEVRRAADRSAGPLLVTEWNEGKYIDEPCFVTDHFGRDSGLRPVPPDTVIRVWRPSLPLSGAAPE